MSCYIYNTGKLSLDYDVVLRGKGYEHVLMVCWNEKVTGIMRLFNNKKKPDIYQFYESLELVDKRFFRTFNWLDEWGQVIQEFDTIIKKK